MKTTQHLRSLLFFTMIPLVLLSFMGCEKNKDDKNDPKIPLPNPVINFNPSITYGSLSDVDGNVYKTVVIKGKTWMAENLRVTRFSNGDAIPNVADSASWSKLTTAAYCDYLNTSDISKVYGRLYNEYAINDSRNLCPTGWRVGTGIELNGTVDLYNAFGDLKETDTIHWKSPNSSATNSTGFTALPSGFRTGNGSFSGIGEVCYYYDGSGSTYRYALQYNSNRMNGLYGGGTTNMGISVRCVQD